MESSTLQSQKTKGGFVALQKPRCSREIMKHTLVVILVILALLLPACNGSSPPPPYLSTSVSPSSSGSITPGSGSYKDGSTVTLTAQPASGYVFDHWAGDASGTSPTTTITMNSDKSVTAYFTYSPPDTVSMPSTPSGPPTGNVEQSLTYTTGGSKSSKGYSIKYRFDWGDGDYSEWSSSPSASHSWASPGDYMVRAQAKSAVNPNVLSSWSDGKSVTLEKPSIPLNVRIDYTGVIDAKGGNDYGENPSKGEIQLVIVISDGKNEPQRWYVPKQTQKGLEGFKEGIQDYSVKKIDQEIYHTASAGDYLKLSIMVYDIDSNENLLTDAAMLEVLGQMAGVPEVGVIKQLVALLPEKDNDLVGEYEETWYPDEDYGIGQHHVAKCLDGSANENFFVWFSVWSDKSPGFPERPYLLGVPKVQALKCTMAPGYLAGSYAQYKKDLQAGEKVNGFLKLTGYHSYVDWDHTCCFGVYDPDGCEVDKWCEDFKEGGLYHEFNFTASRSGEYTIEVEHASYYNRELYIEVSPYGWQE